jgi:hypothetical protein
MSFSFGEVKVLWVFPGSKKLHCFGTYNKNFIKQQNLLTLRAFMSFSFGKVKMLWVFCGSKSLIYLKHWSNITQEQNTLTFRAFMSFSFRKVKMLWVYARLKKLHCFWTKKQNFLSTTKHTNLQSFYVLLLQRGQSALSLCQIELGSDDLSIHRACEQSSTQCPD